MPRSSPSGELFPSEQPALPIPTRDAPLAERMRPRGLDEFHGQDHLLAVDRPLGPLVKGEGRLGSIIFWGPPGSGKTTLAALLAEKAGLRFSAVSAVLAGVKDLRAAVAEAQKADRGTVLFVDEIHRFNKAQQDALLPYVEHGTVVLIGATTENPSFEVISALRSRCRVFTLKALEDSDIARIVNAVREGLRGVGDTAETLGVPELLYPRVVEDRCRLAGGGLVVRSQHGLPDDEDAQVRVGIGLDGLGEDGLGGVHAAAAGR